MKEPVPELSKFADGWYKTGATLNAWWIPLRFRMDEKAAFANEGQTWEAYSEEMKSLQKAIWDVCKDFVQKT